MVVATLRVGSELSIFKRPPTVTERTLAHFEVTDIEATVRDLEANTLGLRQGWGLKHGAAPAAIAGGPTMGGTERDPAAWPWPPELDGPIAAPTSS